MQCDAIGLQRRLDDLEEEFEYGEEFKKRLDEISYYAPKTEPPYAREGEK